MSYYLFLPIPAVMLASQTIQLGINDVVVAGGMESMSNAPKYLAEARCASMFFSSLELFHTVFCAFLKLIDLSKYTLSCKC